MFSIIFLVNRMANTAGVGFPSNVMIITRPPTDLT